MLRNTFLRILIDSKIDSVTRNYVRRAANPGIDKRMKVFDDKSDSMSDFELMGRFFQIF